MVPTIRTVRVEDLRQLLQIEAEAAPKSRLAAWELLTLSLSYRETFLVAEGDRILGYVVFSPKDRIISLVVGRKYRRRGVGTLLMQEVIRRCPGTRLTLEVRVGNQGARSFYQKLGFRESARMPGYYPDGEDGLLMEMVESTPLAPVKPPIPS
ncbi:MAG TPA: GNAT family N-acetyltransferase [Syntrophobacteria bacterium]|nr:GNAT family N-acetyltransferase [Syntrophobacteria bacterium]